MISALGIPSSHMIPESDAICCYLGKADTSVTAKSSDTGVHKTQSVMDSASEEGIPSEHLF
jgi:hypothetical protein